MKANNLGLLGLPESNNTPGQGKSTGKGSRGSKSVQLSGQKQATNGRTRRQGTGNEPRPGNGATEKEYL